MRRAVTSHALEMNGALHASGSCLPDGVASLVGTLVYKEPPPTVLEHLRHERERFGRATRIERTEDLRLAANLDHFSRVQVENGFMIRIRHFRPPHLHVRQRQS